MPFEIRVPQLSESVVEATIGRWLKREGEAVTAGEDLVELETDKANFPISAERSGVLARIEKQKGDTVAANDLLGLVEEGAVKADAPSRERSRPATAPEAENGKSRSQASPVAAQMAAESGLDLARIPGSGPGGKVLKEDVEGFLRKPESPPAKPMERAVSAAEPTPAGRTQAAESAPAPAETPVASSAPSAGAGSLPLQASDRPEERRPMPRMRQIIARRLVEAQHTAAMLTTFNEVDMSAVMEIRKRRREAFKERHGVGLGFMSFFTRAVVGALKAFPLLNAEIRGDEIVEKGYYDIGIAVSIPDGLVVPVIRNADRKSFAAIEKEIVDLAGRAREGRLNLPELMGGTFTITNGGVFGSLLSTPILNAPQVGILGLHKIEERPIALNGEVVIRPMMYLALSYDHRIVDGSEAVQFLVRVKDLIADPEALLLEA